MLKRTVSVITIAAFAIALTGCNGAANEESNGGAPNGTADNSAETPATAAGHGGPIIELGTATIGPFTVRASRDEGEIKAGGDAPIDVWLTPSAEGNADISNVSAVRFWIGTQSGAESVKARADIENPDQPNHWHTHADVPSPLPAGSKLWVEIEMNDGATHVGSFELNA